MICELVIHFYSSGCCNQGINYTLYSSVKRWLWLDLEMWLKINQRRSVFGCLALYCLHWSNGRVVLCPLCPCVFVNTELQATGGSLAPPTSYKKPTQDCDCSLLTPNWMTHSVLFCTRWDSGNQSFDKTNNISVYSKCLVIINYFMWLVCVLHFNICITHK